MTTSYTSLLGLALPVTGELQGTWGDTVNQQITELLDAAVAGTTTISVDADITLSTTTGAANQSRQAILLWTASGTATRYITAPAQSKAYVVINKTGGTQSIVIRGAGPTTGVTVPANTQVLVAWNGSDFVQISSSEAVIGPASSTDNAVARFDGTTGKLLQNSNVIIADDGTTVISVNSATDALRITQTGAGNALVVEDSTNPDSTPFVVNASGNVGIGTATPTVKLQVEADSGLTIAGRTSAASAAARLQRANGTLASPTVVLASENLGVVSFEGYDGSAYRVAASITGRTDSTSPSAGSMPGALFFGTTPAGATASTARMIINSVGNVGIGGAPQAGITLDITKAQTGAPTAYTAASFINPDSTVTTAGYGFSTYSFNGVGASTPNIYHFSASQGTYSGTAPTNQYGFVAQSFLTGATNNYGFFSDIASGTGRWNFYANGTADNYFAGNVGIGTSSPAVKLAVNSTDAILLPKGTTAQQPTGVSGYLRFNTDTSQFEGYNGTAWSSVGGASISNDTSTASNLYPIFANATSGSATTVYTSNAKLLYKPSTGEFSASVPRASNGIFASSASISASYTVASGDNAMSPGTVTVNNGVTVTVSNGSRWVVV